MTPSFPTMTTADVEVRNLSRASTTRVQFAKVACTGEKIPSRAIKVIKINFDGHKEN